MSGRIFRRAGLSRVSLERRRVCCWLLLPAVQWFIAGRADAAMVASARLWPAQEYTRLILDAPAPMAHQLLVMKNPDRLVLDLEGVDLNPELEQLPQRVLLGDPYIRAIRIAMYRPGVLRVVLDLKTEVNPQLFALKPVAEYGYRVVLDLYPLTPLDPLMALLEIERNQGVREPASAQAPVANAPAANDRAAGKSAPRRRIDRPPRHLRKERHSRYCQEAQGFARRRAGNAGGAHPRRRLFRASRRPCAEGAPCPGGPVHFHPCRRVHDTDCSRLVGVRALGARRDQRCRTPAGTARERGRSDRRGQSECNGAGSRQDLARHVANGADQRQPARGTLGPRRHRRDQHAAQGQRRTGRVRGAEGPGHSVDSG
ncbi:MAG: AMIN domain-containing protein [Betaproteobacteria bacterium]|nr:MAG: AMIN domain-containing protein [Betaproteobacteria bacterium]